MVSNEYIICPYCKYKNLKNEMIGSSGLINQSGYYGCLATCHKCKKEFYYDVDVILKIKTRKYI